MAFHLQFNSDGGQRWVIKKDKTMTIPNLNTPEEDIFDSFYLNARFSTHNASSKYDFVKVPCSVPHKSQGEKENQLLVTFFVSMNTSCDLFIRFYK